MSVRPNIPALITTSAGTAEGSPQTTNVSLRPGLLTTVHLTIPTGHVGITGIRLEYSGQRILPFSGHDWIRGNGQERTFTLEFPIGFSDLQVLTFNPDIFDHSHLLEFEIVEITEGAAPSFGARPGTMEGEI